MLDLIKYNFKTIKMTRYKDHVKSIIENNPGREKNILFKIWLNRLGLNISILRKEKGYSQQEFAEKLDVNQSAVARIESGQNMRCSTLWAISEVLDIDLSVFGARKFAETTKFKNYLGTETVNFLLYTAVAPKDFYQPYNNIFNPLKNMSTQQALLVPDRSTTEAKYAQIISMVGSLYDCTLIFYQVSPVIAEGNDPVNFISTQKEVGRIILPAKTLMEFKDVLNKQFAEIDKVESASAEKIKQKG